MGIKLQVPVGTLPFAGPYIRGRNGDFEITALRIHQWGQDDPKGDGAVDVHGIGKRGVPIVGGFRCLMAQDIDALCKAWIVARGGLVIMPDDDDVAALVTTCSGVVESVIVGRDFEKLDWLGQAYLGDRDPDKYGYQVERLEWSEMVAGSSLLLEPPRARGSDIAP
ncbi:MAG: hypothetical protein E3J25_02655 [Anaerolineales bacterium]|nr:MAG: hypothetical protein E3J25_02655 [Anaerolineales bacterium]